jgi:hypothetical protein
MVIVKEDIFEIIEFAASCITEHVVTRDGGLVSYDAPPDLIFSRMAHALPKPSSTYVKIQSPSGVMYSAVDSFKLEDILITSSPYSTGPIWSTSGYEGGNYTVWAESTGNDMNDNYPQDGKTISSKVTFLLQNVNPLITPEKTTVITTITTLPPTTIVTTSIVPPTVETPVITSPPLENPTTIPSTQIPGFQPSL